MNRAVLTDRHEGPDSTTPNQQGRRRRLGPGVLTALTAALALASGVTALLFDLVPALKPDPRERLGAAVSIFDVEPRVSYGEWLRRTDQWERLRREGRDAGRLPGKLVYVETRIEGFKRRSASLRWSVYRARTRIRLASPAFRNQHAVDVRLDAPTDRSLQEVWIPDLPSLRGPFFVRVELRDRNKVLLAVADSKRFGQ